MSDLVKQLQGIATRVPINTNYVKIVCEKAADRIEELEKEAVKSEMVINSLCHDTTVADLIDRFGEFKELKL